MGAINGTIAVGGTTGFAFKDSTGATVTETGVSYSVTSSNASTGFFNGSTFTATAPGTYTIQAAIGTQDLTTTVTVAGSAASVALSAASTSLVANSASTDAITAKVVDTNGNTVASFNGTMQINYVDSSGAATTGTGSQLVNPTTGAAVTTNAGITANVVNGVATFKVQATNAVGVTNNLQVMSIEATGSSLATQYNGIDVTSSTLGLTTVAQKATSLKIVAPSTISESSTSTASVKAEVLDQAGQPMISGTYPVTFTIASGPVTVSGGTSSTSYTGNYVGAASPTDASMTIQSEQGKSGAISITAASTGLTSATASMNAVATSTPTALTLTANKTSFVQGATGVGNVADITIQAVDANGNPVPDLALGSATAGSVTVNITSGGNAATSLSVGTISSNSITLIGQPNSSGNVTVRLASDGSAEIAVWDATTNNDAGSYTVSVSSTANGYNLPAQTTTITENAGTIGGAAFTSPANAVSVTPSNTAVTETFQLQDANGNPISQAGVAVNLTAVGVTNHSTQGHTATLNGTSKFTVTTTGGATATGTALSLTTNSSGQVSVTLAPQGYTGDEWQVEATVPVQAGIGTAISNVMSPIVTVVSAQPASINAQINDTTAGTTNATAATAGDLLSLVLTAQDQYGNTVSGNADTLKVTLPPQLSGGNAAPTGSTMNGSSTWQQYGTNVVDVPLLSGTATVAGIVASQAGSGTVSISDTNSTTSVTGSAPLYVTAQTPSTVAVFDNGALVNASNTIAVSANTPVALQVTPVDAQMNAGVSTSTVTYSLSDGGASGQFSLTQGGSAVTQVTVPSNSTGVTVYYTNSSSNSAVDISASPMATTAVLSGSVAIVGTPADLTLTTYGQNLNGTYTLNWTGANAAPNAATATLPSSATFTNGVATLPVTLVDAAAQTLTVTVQSTPFGNVTSTMDAVTPSAGTAMGAYIKTESPTTGVTLGTIGYSNATTATQSFTGETAATYTLTLQAVDAYGNDTTTGSSVNVAFAAGQTSAPAADGNTLANGGTAITTSASQTLTSGQLSLTYTVAAAAASATPDTITITTASGITTTISLS